MIDRQIVSNGKQLLIGQNLSLSHAGSIWDGALCMIAYWNKNKKICQKIIHNKNVLELGSGTGVVGLAACAFKPKSIYLTDIPQFLTILQQNKNKNKWDQNNTQPIIKPLAWGNKQHIAQIKYIDTIIGSQLAYDKQNAQLLMQTISSYRIENPNLNVMISYQKYKDQDKNIQILFCKHFGKEFYKLVEWDDMDYTYRDNYIGILYSI